MRSGVVEFILLLTGCASQAPALPPLSGGPPLSIEETSKSCSELRNDLAKTDDDLLGGKRQAASISNRNEAVHAVGVLFTPAFVLSRGQGEISARNETFRKRRDRIEFLLNQKRCG